MILNCYGHCITPHAARLTLNASRLTQNAERFTPHAERFTPHAERRTLHAVITVTYQAIRAAVANPVKILRSE